MNAPELVVAGAGAVGLALAARLARGGVRVLVVVRRPEVARALAHGVEAEDAASFEVQRFAVEVALGVGAPAGARAAWLLCVRSADTEALASEIARSLSTPPCVVTFANDIANESTAARHLPCVIGGVWRETCTRVSEARVRFLPSTQARAVVGRHPHGACAEADAIAAVLRRGGIDVGVSPRIGEDKWLKLCVNLTSAPNALVRRSDHATPAFVETKLRLLREARDVLEAAGIRASSCDGRDRSLADEILHHETSLARGVSARPLPLYNQVWASLRRGSPLEADAYHRRILELAARHGLAAPTNARVLERLLLASSDRRGPECFSAAELLAD